MSTTSSFLRHLREKNTAVLEEMMVRAYSFIMYDKKCSTSVRRVDGRETYLMDLDARPCAALIAHELKRRKK